jgi:tetratricopeptide (TPR) repeat protein
VEFLAEASDTPLVLWLDNLHEADPGEQELVAILLRRSDPARVRVMVTGAEGTFGPELAAALDRYADRVDAPDASPGEAAAAADPDDLVKAFVASDGTSDAPEKLAAYEQADPAVRAALHDARAEELERQADASLRLGAIPYHREHGSDPSRAGGRALLAAAYSCLELGFYPAVLDLGLRGRAVVDAQAEPDLYWQISTKATTALAALDRAEEAEPIYHELRARYSMVQVHLFSSYALGMLYTRYHRPGRKDHQLARGYLNNAIALASQIADPGERAFSMVFQQNGLALVEMHVGDLAASLRLVTEGLERLSRELDPEHDKLHRSVLLHNRAQVLAGLGRLDEALADFSALIDDDPNYAEYHFDRANLLHRMGDDEAALEGYARAMALTPPFPEVHFNRAEALRCLGDVEGAIADLTYALELEPDHADARLNRAALLLESGDPEGARTDVQHGLKLQPDSPHLHCTLGLVAMETGDPKGALESFGRALELDPSLHAALSNRAMVHYEDADFDAALADLTRALDLVGGGDPDLLYNRGYVHQAAGRLDLAVQDYTRALELPGADIETVAEQLERCLA